MAQPLLVNPTGPYIHKGSGFVFPVASGVYRRVQIVEYDAQATDVGVNYDLVLRGGGKARYSIYVYPAPSVPEGTGHSTLTALCADQFRGIKAEIAGAHSDAKLIEEKRIEAPFPGTDVAGQQATFDFSDGFGPVQAYRSEADLFCFYGTRWLIAYRITAPAGAWPELDRAGFIKSLPWPPAR